MKFFSWTFLFGSLILVFVDFLWVTSSEITEYLYKEKQFNRPFFTAYIKSCMFSVYLLGFIFCDSWWLQKNPISNNYYTIADSDQQNLTNEDDDDDEDIGEEISDSLNNHRIDPDLNDSEVLINCDSHDIELIHQSRSNFLGDSIWLPIKRCSDTSSLSGKSETEDEESISSNNCVEFLDDSTEYKDSDIAKRKLKTKFIANKAKNLKSKISSPSSKRSVRFSHLIEVRQMSDKHAYDAFLSRLSYSSFMRLLYQSKPTYNKASNFEEDSGDLRKNRVRSGQYDSSKLSIKETALFAFYFMWIWFAAHLSIHMGFQYSEAGLVNVLSSTTPLFTLILGTLFPSGSSIDSLSLTKLLCVLISISSVAMISNIGPVHHHHEIDNFHPRDLLYSQTSLDDSSSLASSSKFYLTKSNYMNDSNFLPLGSIWSLCGAFFYACYIVLMRYNLPNDAILNFPMFFGNALKLIYEHL
ncbi:Eukaryotic translation initiation factor 3 subunit D [Sarcoptes scabiei]|nr:Eukaryotic translation initiation factor 3 subunit D [Sarcoptes scabiei]